MFATLIPLLVPVVLSLINKIIPSGSATPSQQHAWVQAFFVDFGQVISKYLPSWALPAEQPLEQVLATLVQAELDKLLPAS